MEEFSNNLTARYVLDHYSISAVLGTGSFGITCKAYENQLNQPVAIKEYLPSDMARRTSNNATLQPCMDCSGQFRWGLAKSKIRTAIVFCKLASIASLIATVLPMSVSAATVNEICEASRGAHGVLESRDVASILGELTGSKRWSALRCLGPKIKSDLTGDDLALILGSGPSFRSSMIYTLKEDIRANLDAQGVAVTLGDLKGGRRWSALRSLEPNIKSGLTGNDLALILGSDPSFRSSMIHTLKENVRANLDAQSVAVTLGDLKGGKRWSGLRSLQPNIKFGLTGDDLALILGSDPSFRSSMICTLKEHTQNDLDAREVAASLGDLSGNTRSSALRCLEVKEKVIAENTTTPSDTSIPTLTALRPSSEIGYRCSRNFILVGRNFQNDLKIEVKATGVNKLLAPEKVTNIKSDSAEIALITGEDPDNFYIRAKNGDGPYSENITLTIRSPSGHELGAVIGEFGGVEAKSNGVCTGKLSGSCDKNYQCEAPYQCVDYAKRYYKNNYPTVTGVNSAWGSAQEYWDRSEHPKLTRTIYATAGVEEASLPHSGDMIFFRTGQSDGHVAIVRGVNDAQITIIQQNIKNDTAYDSLSLTRDSETKLLSIKGSYEVLGWLSPNN